MKTLFIIAITLLTTSSYSQLKNISIDKSLYLSNTTKEVIRGLNNNYVDNINSKVNNSEFNNNLSLSKDFSKTGSISPDAVIIDATEIDDFHLDRAIIRKGESFAVINFQGKFIIPYGKYKFNVLGGYKIDKSKCGFINDMCAVRDVETEKFGFVDLYGNLIVPCTLNDVTPYMKDGYAWAKEKGSDGKEYQEFINVKGRKYPVRNLTWYNSTPSFLNIFPVKGNSGFTEYYNKTGKLVFKTRKTISGKYSEGLIRVDTTYELVGKKSGFIDTTGKLIIPYKFKVNNASNNLNDFHEGLALYEPLNKEECQYIYINKKADTVLKLRLSERLKQLYIDRGDGNFNHGFAYITANNKPAYMDKDKTILILPDYIESNNLDFSSKYKSFRIFYKESAQGDLSTRTDVTMVFSAAMETDIIVKMKTSGFGGGKEISKSVGTTISGYGVVSVVGKILIAPLFDSIGFLDFSSHLCLATYTDKTTNTSTTGYVNEDGVFVIVQSKK